MARTPWKMYTSAWNFPGKCSCEFCRIAKKSTLDFKLNSQLDSWLTLENFSKFFFFNADSKSEKNLPFYTMCLSSLFKEL